MPREIDLVPFASNDSNTDFLFSQREYYVSSSDVYPEQDQFNNTLPQPLDIWYERPYWGKVDTKGRLVLPDVTYLRSIANGLSAMNFVAAAYIDLRDYVLNARNRLRTSMTTFINIDDPIKAHDDVVIQYKDYFENTIDPGFVNVFLSDIDKNKIYNFLDFSREYFSFVEVNPEIPHTLAGYLVSPKMSYRNSGLIIEFADDQYDKDSDKWVKYLSNDFFSDYTKLTSLFGFYVNKHVPWSIAPNLYSTKMRNYMVPYRTTNIEKMFSKNYLQAEHISYISFKKYMFLSYASFISHRPRIEIVRYENCIRRTVSDSSYRTEREIALRPTEISYFDPSYSKFTSIYSDYTFMKIYVKIRLIEEGIKLNKLEYDRLITKLVLEYQGSDDYGAMLLFSEYLAQRRMKNFSKLTRRKKSDSMSSNSTNQSGGSLASYFPSQTSNVTTGY